MNSQNTSNANQALVATQDDVAVKTVSLSTLTPASAGARLLDGNLGLISNVKVRLEVVVGDTEISVSDLFALQKGSVVEMEQAHHAPLTLRLDGRPVALGSLVVVGDKFGIQITDILAAGNGA